MVDYIIGTPEFIKKLDNWLLTSQQSDADWMYRNRIKIPEIFRKYSKPIFRGMTVNENFIDDLNSKGIMIKNHVSWTKNENVARDFAHGKGGIKQTGDIKILIKKTVAPNFQIFDIHAYAMFMGIPQLKMLGIDELNIQNAMKEEEIIISKNLKITKSDVKIIT